MMLLRSGVWWLYGSSWWQAMARVTRLRGPEQEELPSAGPDNTLYTLYRAILSIITLCTHVLSRYMYT